MSALRPGPSHAQGLPTLTEVIEGVDLPAPPRAAAGPTLPVEALPVLDDVVAPAVQAALDAPAFDEVAVAPTLAALSEEVPAVDEDAVVLRVLSDLQHHADLMLEHRLREALSSVVARLTDALVRDVREEFGVTLRAVVAEAVNQELARRRGR